ncbi:MAG: transcriptional regulator, DeoR family [Actinomycetia bacterium]|jgi:DNA-binding transcriptional regulator LsrR (DeoR family)|nr:transcriptional regulator, DeoR family [Actinomycetes bacterium]
MDEGSPIERLQAAHIARRYFLGGQTKSLIAEEFGLSRFKVARLIEDSVKQGIVKIEIDMPAEVDVGLSQELEQRFGLERAVVVVSMDPGGDLLREQLGKAGAQLVAELVTPEDVIGLSWGRTLEQLAWHLPPLPRCPVVQIVGGSPVLKLSASPQDLVRQFGERTGGLMFPLHAPMFVEDAEVATGLRKAPLIASTLKLYASLTLAIVAIGSWSPPMSCLYDSLDSPARIALRRQGACADLCTLLLGQAGEVIDTGFYSRAISITREELEQVPKVLAVAGGLEKSEAVHAALRSGLLTGIVTDSIVARAILDTDSAAGRPGGAH